jgi:hypothetical protein
MPPLALHMGIAKELADGLRHPALEADLGAYYLGSTAPDIHVLTRWERERTHFFDLNEFGHQDGVAALFSQHPELADRGRLNPSTGSFMAGYVSHLVMDEVWIEDIYRPFFGQRSPLGGDARANVLDRVLQYELDRRERTKREIMEHVRLELAASALEIYVGFIDAESLRRWRDISVEVAAHAPDWASFRYLAGRHLRAYGVGTPEALEEFIEGVPEMLSETVRLVGWDRVQAFLDRSRSDTLRAIKDYLS